MTRPTITIYSTTVPLVFDGTLALAFIVEVISEVENATVKNIAPGAMYTFMFHQDAKGHRVTWPDNCINASPVDTTPGAITVQNFIGTEAGNLMADLPAAVWKKP